MTRSLHPRRLALAAVLVAVSAPALAQQPSPVFAREYQAGIDAYRLGKYAEARAHLTKAIDFEPKLPGPYRWLAAVDTAEEKWADCVVHARTAIKLNPQSSEIGATRELHDKCRSELGRTPFRGDFEGGGALAVTANVDGATVSVNGLRYGATPMAPRATAIGEIDLGVEKVGWLTQTVKVDILPGVVTDVQVVLVVDPAAKKPEVAPEVKPVVPTTGWIALDVDAPGAAVAINGMDVATDTRGRYERPPGTYEVLVTAPGRERWRRRVRVSRGQETRVHVTLDLPSKRRGARRIGIAFVSGAAAIAGAGVAFGLLGAQAREDARDWWEIERTRPPMADSSGFEPIHTREDIEDAVDRSDRWSLYSNIAYGTAAATLGVGIYFLIKARPEEREGRPAPFALAPVVGDGQVGVRTEVRW